MGAFEKFDPYVFLQGNRAPGMESEVVKGDVGRKTLATLATLAGPPAEIEICGHDNFAVIDGSDQWNKIQFQTPTPAKVAKVAKVQPPGAASPYKQVLESLECRCPDFVDAERWQQAVEDGGRFLASWGNQAHAFGWTARELFGLHTPPARPAASYSRLSRYDEIGLVWLLRGRPVIALTATTAAIQGATSLLTYRKLNKPALGPLGDSLDDMGTAT